MNDFDLTIEILESIFGDHKNHYPNKGQISFDCPVCSYDIKGLDKGDGKGNLEVNYHQGVFKCWACSETNNTKGGIWKLIRKYGDQNQKQLFELSYPEEPPQFKRRINQKLVLPHDFTYLKDANRNDLIVKQAFNYLKRRNITEEMVEKYKIGYSASGEHKFRIVVPSFNKEGKINYFVARSFVNTKLKYKNPQVQKDTIIFNEPNINWEDDIYLVEGVFDMFFLKNAIPILGKVISNKLWETLYDEAKKDIIICLDGDAWDDGVKLYDKLNGGKLRGRVKIVKMPKNKDVADLGGNINKDNILSLEKN